MRGVLRRKSCYLIVLITFCVLDGDTSSSAQPQNWKTSLATEDDPILKKKSLVLDDKYFSSLQLQKITEVLAEEMFSHFRILGISAPQMSVGIRVFLLRSSFINPFNRSFEVYINPKIVSVGDVMDTEIEFCLSTRGFHRIKRYQTIQLEFSKMNGVREVIELTGSRARIAQHELDHLDGKLISSDK